MSNEKIRLIITGRCNLSCFYCHNEGQAKEDTFASTSDIRAVLNALTAHAVPLSEITVSGGEPLVHPRVETLVACAAEAASQVTMVSNGVLATPQLLRRLAGSGLKKLRLGIDSLRPTKPRPSPGFLDVAFGVDPLLSTAAEVGLMVDLNVVITRFNHREIPRLVEFATARGLSVKFFEHVEVATYGSAGLGGAMTSVPHLTFDNFHRRIEEATGRPVSFRPHPEFGAANMTAHIDATEIRYCRFLCDYDLCWLTGTRLDARLFAYNCMSNRGLDQLNIGSPEGILDGLACASARPCRSDAQPGNVT